MMVTVLVFQYYSTSGEKARKHLAEYRQTFFVKLGTTTDTSIVLTPSLSVSLTTGEKKFSNRNRTFRAYLIKGSDGVSRVAFEAAKPHSFYELSGSYAVSSETVGLIWKNNSTLSFSGVDEHGIPTHFELQLNDLILREAPLPFLVKRLSAPAVDVD